MHWEGHVGAALLAYAPVGTWLAVTGYGPLALVGAAATVALATLPDGDHAIPLVSHRGFTHTVAFALVVGGVVGTAGVTLAGISALALGPPETVGWFGFLLGTLSILLHVALDALTPMGVRPLWPLSRWHVTLSLAPSKSPIANWTLLVAGVLASASGLLVAAG